MERLARGGGGARFSATNPANKWARALARPTRDPRALAALRDALRAELQELPVFLTILNILVIILVACHPCLYELKTS